MIKKTNIPIPKGAILLWHGSIASIPAGWALCNGSNGTPDLRDKFIVGASQDDGGVAKAEPYAGVGLQQSGGIAYHIHEYDGTTQGPDATEAGDTGGAATEATGTHGHFFIGTTNATSHIPPFYALVYIMKL